MSAQTFTSEKMINSWQDILNEQVKTILGNDSVSKAEMALTAQDAADSTIDPELKKQAFSQHDFNDADVVLMKKQGEISKEAEDASRELHFSSFIRRWQARIAVLAELGKVDRDDAMRCNLMSIRADHGKVAAAFLEEFKSGHAGANPGQLQLSWNAQIFKSRWDLEIDAQVLERGLNVEVAAIIAKASLDLPSVNAFDTLDGPRLSQLQSIENETLRNAYIQCYYAARIDRWKVAAHVAGETRMITEDQMIDALCIDSEMNFYENALSMLYDLQLNGVKEDKLPALESDLNEAIQESKSNEHSNVYVAPELSSKLEGDIPVQDIQSEPKPTLKVDERLSSRHNEQVFVPKFDAGSIDHLKLVDTVPASVPEVVAAPAGSKHEAVQEVPVTSMNSDFSFDLGNIPESTHESVAATAAIGKPPLSLSANEDRLPSFVSVATPESSVVMDSSPAATVSSLEPANQRQQPGQRAGLHASPEVQRIGDSEPEVVRDSLLDDIPVGESVVVTRDTTPQDKQRGRGFTAESFEKNEPWVDVTPPPQTKPNLLKRFFTWMGNIF